MPQFTTLETFSNAPVNLVSGITDMLIREQGGNRMLYTATRAGGGVLAIDIDSGMVVADQITYSVTSQLPVDATLDVVTAGNLPRLLISGSNQTTLFGHRIEEAGTLGISFRPTGGPAGVISAQGRIEIAGTTYIYAARANDGAVQTYRMAADGTLTLLQDLPLGADLQGVNLSALQPLQAGGTQFLAVASLTSDRITLLRVAGNGLLTEASSLGAAEGLGIADPSGLSALTAYGTSYLVVASGSSSSLTLMAVSSSGQLTVSDQLIDTLATRFQGVTTAETFTFADRAFVLAGGGDGGLNLFEILPGGRMVLSAELLDTPSTALEAIRALTVRVTATGAEVFVAGEGTGITRLSLDLSAMLPVPGAIPGLDALTGGSGDDLLVGTAGNDTLTGGAGSDVLADGAGRDAMYGGAGADLFVMSADGVADTIGDFQAGLDRLDLSAWGGGLSTAAVQITPTTWGAILRVGAEEVQIRSSNGLPLTANVLQQAGLFDLWHVEQVLPTAGGEMLGTEGSNLLAAMAGAGASVFRGLGGDDTMMGGAGADRFYGGSGIDTVSYESASAAVRVDMLSTTGTSGEAAGDRFDSIERIIGSAFADTVCGDSQGNVLSGMGTGDVLLGRGGNDTLYGGSGNDVLAGGAGADVLDGGSGARDRAQYSDAAAGVRVDFLQIAANTGDAAGDSYTGIEDLQGSAYGDTLLGNTGANILWGGAGDDLIYGRSGGDTLYGGEGNDRLGSGSGADLLDGGAGARDRVQYGAATGAVYADFQLLPSNRGFAAGDVYQGIEDLEGSTYGDTLAGDGAANILWGGAGNDVLHGRSGADTLYGGDGNDRLIGGAGADRLEGGAGSRDSASYGDATAGVQVDLRLPGSNTGYAAGDSYAGIEDLLGSAYGDTIRGDGLGNILWGEAGDDALFGREGGDVLYGGSGNDALYGGAGADRLYGGEGSRDRASYTDASAPVRADLQAPATNTGFAAGDLYDGIEDLGGSDHADTLSGDGGGNMIWGGAGDDLIHGRSGADTIYGGAGGDRLRGGAGADQLAGGSGADQFIFADPLGAGNVDRILDFNPVEDSLRLDPLIFTRLLPGGLATNAFRIGTVATAAADRIVYDRDSGQLYYDADGSGSGAAVLFATVTAGTLVSAADIFVA